MIRADAQADKVTGPWARKRPLASADAPPHLNPLPRGEEDLGRSAGPWLDGAVIG